MEKSYWGNDLGITIFISSKSGEWFQHLEEIKNMYLEHKYKSILHKNV